MEISLTKIISQPRSGYGPATSSDRYKPTEGPLEAGVHVDLVSTRRQHERESVLCDEKERSLAGLGVFVERV